MDGGIDLVRQLTFFILADCDTRYIKLMYFNKDYYPAETSVYVVLYYRPAVSTKSYNQIGLYIYFNPPDGHYRHAVYSLFSNCPECTLFALQILHRLLL